MWKKFSKKIKKIIMSKKIYNLGYSGFIYPLTKQLIFDGRKNKIFNNNINLKIPIILYHGAKDKVVPLFFSKKIMKVFNKSKKKLVIVKNGDHSLSRKSDLNKICNGLKFIIENLNKN